MKHTRTIKLLGGKPALVCWWDGEVDGEIIVWHSEFLTYVHEHTRLDAIEKARRITNEADIKWNLVL